MDSRRAEVIRERKSKSVLFSCEGKAERVIVEKLVESDSLIVPESHVVRDMDGRPCTLLRKAKDIQREFLGVDYPAGLMIGRIVDVNPFLSRLARWLRRSARRLRSRETRQPHIICSAAPQ